MIFFLFTNLILKRDHLREVAGELENHVIQDDHFCL